MLILLPLDWAAAAVPGFVQGRFDSNGFWRAENKKGLRF
jgi:hypothetical protein